MIRLDKGLYRLYDDTLERHSYPILYNSPGLNCDANSWEQSERSDDYWNIFKCSVCGWHISFYERKHLSLATVKLRCEAIVKETP